MTPDVVADIRSRRRGGASLRAMAAAVEVSTFSVRRALTEPEPTPEPTPAPEQATRTEEPQPQAQPQAAANGDDGEESAGEDLPVLPPPADRGAERAAARWGKLPHADPVFTLAARVPLAGLLLAIPALQTTGLLSCATTVFGSHALQAKPRSPGCLTQD